MKRQVPLSIEELDPNEYPRLRSVLRIDMGAQLELRKLINRAEAKALKRNRARARRMLLKVDQAIAAALKMVEDAQVRTEPAE